MQQTIPPSKKFDNLEIIGVAVKAYSLITEQELKIPLYPAVFQCAPVSLYIRRILNYSPGGINVILMPPGEYS